MRIKKGVNPVGTEHYASMQSGPTSITAYYRVIAVTGVAAHLPSEDEPVVYLRLNRKIARPVDTFVSLPLSVFVSIFEQTSEGDVFWEDGAQDGTMLTLAQATDIIRAKINQSSLQV